MELVVGDVDDEGLMRHEGCNKRVAYLVCAFYAASNVDSIGAESATFFGCCNCEVRLVPADWIIFRQRIDNSAILA